MPPTAGSGRVQPIVLDGCGAAADAVSCRPTGDVRCLDTYVSVTYGLQSIKTVMRSISDAEPATVKYLNNIVEQDHRAIKRVNRPMLNFKLFRAAGSVLAGIELIHMIRKGQFAINGAEPMWLSRKLSTLPGMVRPI